jgi:hypothetical protein
MKKKEEERIEQEEHSKNFPDGISSIKSNIKKKIIEFIHLEIQFNGKFKEVEIFDIYSPKKSGYKAAYFENNKYFIVFPFYKTNEDNIFFGIRNIESNDILDDNDIKEDDYLKYNKRERRFELKIIKEKLEYMIFNIYNVPKEIIIYLT